MWKDFFYYSKAERRIIVMLLLLSVALAAIYIVTFRNESAVNIVEDSSEIDSFLVQLKEKDRTLVYNKKVRRQPVVVLQEFDPNTADSSALCELGLPAFIARNILRYREKGGVFRSPESFSRIYGLTEEQFRTLRPYIVIGAQFRKADTVWQRPQHSDSLFTVQKKYEEGTVVDLNRADTTELKCIPGIGTGLARMIVAYRLRMGGFYDVSQLQEIPHLDKELNKWFVVHADTLRKLYVNKFGLDKLRSHPYMDFYKAKAIVEYRRKRGKIKNISQLSLFKEFTEADLKRLSPYLSFE